MSVLETVGVLGLRISQRIVDLIAKHGIFRTLCQYMHAGGIERQRSMRRENFGRE